MGFRSIPSWFNGLDLFVSFVCFVVTVPWPGFE